MQVNLHRLGVWDVGDAVELEEARGLVVAAILTRCGVPLVDETLRGPYPSGVALLQLGAACCRHFDKEVGGLVCGEYLRGPEAVKVGRGGLGDKITPPTYISVCEPFTIRVFIAIVL